MIFIKIKLRRGFNLITSIFDTVQKNDCMIMGGFARWCASPLDNPAPSSDVDIYPKRKGAFEEMLRELERLGFEHGWENDVSLLLKNPDDSKFKELPKIQLIKPIEQHRVITFGSEEEILSKFDFTITCVCILNKNECLVHESFEADEKDRRLIWNNIHCPVSSFFRAIKYIKKGYRIHPFELYKLFLDWDERDTEYKARIGNFLEAVSEHNEDGSSTLTEEQIQEMEALLAFD